MTPDELARLKKLDSTDPLSHAQAIGYIHTDGMPVTLARTVLALAEENERLAAGLKQSSEVAEAYIEESRTLRVALGQAVDDMIAVASVAEATVGKGTISKQLQRYSNTARAALEGTPK